MLFFSGAHAHKKCEREKRQPVNTMKMCRLRYSNKQFHSWNPMEHESKTFFSLHSRSFLAKLNQRGTMTTILIFFSTSLSLSEGRKANCVKFSRARARAQTSELIWLRTFYDVDVSNNNSRAVMRRGRKAPAWILTSHGTAARERETRKMWCERWKITESRMGKLLI